MVVFSYLEKEDRLEMCLVCKKWLDLINCKSLLGDITVNILCNDFEDYSYPCMSRNFFSFDLLELNTDDIWENGMEYISPCVEFLSLGTNERNRRITLSLDRTFEDLRQLDFYSGNAWHVFPSCPNLTILSLFSDTISDAFISVLQKTMKHLKAFRLYTPFLEDPTEYKEYYPAGVTYEENPSSEVLTFPAIKSFVIERVSTLLEICLSDFPLAASTVKELLCIKGLNLQHLYIYTEENGSTNSSKCFIDIFRRHRNLQTLHIDGFNLNNDVGDATCLFQHNIEELEMSCNVTDKSLKGVFQLQKLKKLDISKCTGFTPSGCREAIASFKSIQIKYLKLQNFLFPKDSASFLKQLTHLVHLELNLSLVTDSHVHIISTYLVNLENLFLRQNDGISDYGLTAVSVLKENQDKKISYKPLRNLKHLVTLDLSHCTKLTDDGIIAAVRFPLLSTLVLHRLNFSEITYSVLISQNPQLTRIERD